MVGIAVLWGVGKCFGLGFGCYIVLIVLLVGVVWRGLGV